MFLTQIECMSSEESRDYFLSYLYGAFGGFLKPFSCPYNMRVSKRWRFLFSTVPFALHTNRISISAFLNMVCLSAKLQIPTAAASSTFAGQSNVKAMTVKMHVRTLGFQWWQRGRLKESDVSRRRPFFFSTGSRPLHPLLQHSSIISHDA